MIPSDGGQANTTSESADTAAGTFFAVAYRDTLPLYGAAVVTGVFITAWYWRSASSR